MIEKYEPGQKVILTILRETDLGYVAKINEDGEGLLYHNEVFVPLAIGQAIAGYINRVRPEGGVDLLLQPFGNFGTDELSEKILAKLKSKGGFLPINDKSSPEDIYALFGVSKKKYKMAIGKLYKQRLIKISTAGIELIHAAKPARTSK